MKLETLRSVNNKVVALSVIVIFAGLGFFGLRMAFASSSSQTYNNIQIFVNPQNSSLNLFNVGAYNSTGGLVASSQSSYPAFSFELPSGNYLFAVSASSSYSYIGPVMNGVAQSQKSSTAYPIYYGNPWEYGYIMTQLNSTKTVNITTHPIDSITTSKVTVVAKYSNGTAAASASVYASIVGGQYNSGYKLVMSNQTGNDGVSTLIVPSVPLEITAWDWVPVNLPQSVTTTQVTIGGEPFNVTVYWQPTYVGLAGSALLVPPSTEADITLKAQQQSYWVLPLGVASSQSGAPTPGGQSNSAGVVASAPGAIPAKVANSQQLGAPSQSITQSISTQVPSLPASTVTYTTTASVTAQASTNSILFESGIVVAVVISIAAVALAIRKK